MITERQEALLAMLTEQYKGQDWIEVLSKNKTFHDDLHALWCNHMIKWNQDGTHIKLL